MRKVLLCDNDTDVLYLMTFALKFFDWQGATSEDCTQILKKVAEHQPSVIIMDNIIPDIGGLESIKILKANSEFKSIPVILYTFSNEISKLAEEVGAEFYYSKPINLNNLEILMDKSYKLFISRITYENA